MCSLHPPVKLTTLARATQRTNQQVVIRNLGETRCLWRGLSDRGQAEALLSAFAAVLRAPFPNAVTALGEDGSAKSKLSLKRCAASEALYHPICHTNLSITL